MCDKTTQCSMQVQASLISKCLFLSCRQALGANNHLLLGTLCIMLYMHTLTSQRCGHFGSSLWPGQLVHSVDFENGGERYPRPRLHAMPSRTDRRCYCGEAFTNHKQRNGARHRQKFVRGQYCLLQEFGAGHWYVALPKLQLMGSASKGERYPRLRLHDIERHVACMNEQHAKRQHLGLCRRSSASEERHPRIMVLISGTPSSPDADREVSSVDRVDSGHRQQQSHSGGHWSSSSSSSSSSSRNGMRSLISSSSSSRDTGSVALAGITKRRRNRPQARSDTFTPSPTPIAERAVAAKTEIDRNKPVQDARHRDSSEILRCMRAQNAEMHAAAIKSQKEAENEADYEADELTPTEQYEDEAEPLTVLNSNDSDASLF